MRFLSALAAVAAAMTLQGAPAFAGELDNEASVTNQAQLAKDLPATLIVRTNLKTKAVEVLNTNEKMAKGKVDAASVAQRNFVQVSLNDKLTASELDFNSSSSSWYFCFPNYNYYQPSYYYSGYQYSYTSYYQYNYGGYNYNYYRNPYYGYGGYGGGWGW